PAQQRRPVQRLLLCRARRDPVRLFEEDFLRCDELVTHGLGWARPAVVEHARARYPRAQASLLATDPKALRVPIRADAPVQPDGADLPSVPVSVGRDRVEVAVEMVIIDEQALDAGLPVPVPYLFAQGRGARFVQHLVRLDVDAPLTVAGGVCVRRSRLVRTCMSCGGRARPPAAHKVAWVPRSTIRPSASTRIRSACCTVASRCAMTNVVRRAIRRSIASCTSRSDSMS